MKQLRKQLSLYVVVPVLVVAVASVIFVTNIALNPSNSGNDNEETTTSNPMDPAIPVPMDLAIPVPMDPAIPVPMDPAIPVPTDPAIPVLQSDIEITRLELSDYGSKLFKESTFSILVQVTNHGQAASGEYTVEIWQELDPNILNKLNVDCPCGAIEMPVIKIMMDSYTMGSLAPGETHTIEKEDALLDREGFYTISVEITPIGWQESNNYHHVVSLDIRVRINLLD